MANRLPLHDRHLAAGAGFESVGEWELPFAYGQPAEEYRAARNAVGLVDRGHWGVLELTGRDRATFLHALVSNEIKALAPGQGCAATLLDVHGKVQVVLFVLVADDRIFVLTPPAMAAKTAEALDHYLFSEKVAIEDVSREHALVVLAGPAARATAERLAGALPPEKPWSHVAAKLGDTPMRLVSGGGETGEAEVGVMCPLGGAPTSRSTTRRSARSRARPGRSGSRGRSRWRSSAASTPSRARACRFASPERRRRRRSARCRSRADGSRGGKPPRPRDQPVPAPA